jgi:hypothetical protein
VFDEEEHLGFLDFLDNILYPNSINPEEEDVGAEM